MKSYVLLCSLLFSITVSAQRKAERWIDENKALQGAQVSVSVFDLKKQKFKLTYRSDKNILPASTIKLVTFFGAYQTFGDELPLLHYKKKNNRIYFWSSGHPLIGHPRYKSATALNFLKKQKDSLFFIPRPITSPTQGKGWAWDDERFSFSAKKSSFPIHGNLIEIISDPNTDVLKVNPSFFKDSISYSKINSAYDVKVNDFKYEISAKKADTLYAPFDPSTTITLRFLENEINRPIYIGIKSDINNEDYKSLFDISDEVYKSLLHESNNQVAESLLLMISGTLQWDFNTEAGIEFVKNKNRDLAVGISQVDGSGLSRYNLITPEVLVEVLNKIYSSLGDAGIKKYFAQLNKNGTLKNYVEIEKQTFKVYAKSGSLRNNHILAGFIYSKSNRPYAFVISVNNYRSGKQAIQNTITNKLKGLYDKLR
ncbi:D-alanyl-D-alanine carboxypeptidase [Flavobacteriaceae bacterium]|nr:D-alanyl-D-alanine carboxypeptidase [Flavobacteriaceae bacterium]